MASVILSVIVLVLGAGIAVFAAAGALANRETSVVLEAQARHDLASAKSYESELDDRIGRIQEEQKQLQVELNEEISRLRSGGDATVDVRSPLATTLKQQLAHLDQQLGDYKARRRDMERRITEAATYLEQANKTLPKDAQLLSVVSAMSTRVGAIVLLVFLVQILVPLYRYNIKLASYYDARADAIRLTAWNVSAADAARFEQFSLLLSPDLVHFGAAPASPIEQAVDLAKKVVALKGA